MAGANQIYGAGMIESGVTFDFGQLVMDNEIARMIKFAVGGIAVTDETMAVDDIAKVGAFGDFLSLDATLKHMRELSQPEVLDRRVREDWEAAARRTCTHARSPRRVGILETHQPKPLPDDVAEQVHRIIEAADRERAAH